MTRLDRILILNGRKSIQDIIHTSLLNLRLPDIINAVVSVGNNTTTTNTTSDYRNSVEYLEWCKNNNPNHPDHCNSHWEEYQV